MQYQENLETGNKIELVPSAQAQSETKKIYLSKIQDIMEDGKLEILMPMEKGKLILLSVGNRYLVSFYTKAGIFQGEYIIEKRYRDQSRVLLLLKPNSRLAKKQRREYYRLECHQEVSFRVITGSETVLRERIKNESFRDLEEKENYVNYILDIEHEAEWIPAIMLDISGGGIHIKTKKQESLEKHLMFRVSLYIQGEIRQLDLECYVVSVSDVANETGMLELRCQFINIIHQKQEMIVKYIFDQQRKQRALN